MHFKLLHKGCILLGFIGLSFNVVAQYTLGLDASYTIGFNSSPIQFPNQEIDQQWHQGYQLNLQNGYQLKEQPIEITTRIGLKKMVSEGTINDQLFTTEAFKFQLGAGALYHFESDISLGALIVLENNLDADQFISQTSDLFRFSFQLEGDYPIWKELAVRAHYSMALTPLSDHYLLTNPQHQFAVGLQYKFL